MRVFLASPDFHIKEFDTLVPVFGDYRIGGVSGPVGCHEYLEFPPWIIDEKRVSELFTDPFFLIMRRYNKRYRWRKGTFFNRIILDKAYAVHGKRIPEISKKNDKNRREK